MSPPFRDEREAALLRADALERENAALRAELETARRGGGAPRAAARGWIVGCALAAVAAMVAVGAMALLTVRGSPAATAPQATALATAAPPPAVVSAAPVVPQWRVEQAGAVDAPLFAIAADLGSAMAVGARGSAAIYDDPRLGWRPLRAPTSDDVLAVTLDSAGAVAVGRKGAIFRHDPGSGWMPEESPTKRDLHGVARAEGRTFAVGDGGVVLRGGGGALPWTLEKIDATDDLRGVDARAQVAVGARGAVVRLTDARIGWVHEASHTARRLNGVASDGGLVYAVGDDGTILRWSDPRTGWVAEASGTDAALFAVACDGGEAWAVGEKGTVLTRDSSGRWMREVVDTDRMLRAVAVSGGVVLAAGDGGIVLRRSY